MKDQMSLGQLLRAMRHCRPSSPVARAAAVSIGYPCAGVAWNWVGHVGELREEQAAIERARARAGWNSPADWAWRSLNVGAVTGGDITGASGSKAKKARATGQGVDPEWARDQALINWLSASDKVPAALPDSATATGKAELLAINQELEAIRAARASIQLAIIGDQAVGNAILRLCGGRGWGNGRIFVGINSGGMGARAARYVWRGGRGHFRGRGVEPSATSLEECAAAAVQATWFEWCCLSALWPCSFDQVERHLAGVAWRAAFHSLTKDTAQGRTGRKSGQDQGTGSVSIPLDAAALELDRVSLEAWARDRQGRIFASGADDQARERRERRAVLQWVASVLDVRAKGRTGYAERARFSVLARLVHGRDIATAARGAGFASGKQAVESFRAGAVWDRLGSAINARVSWRDRDRLASLTQAAQAVKVAIGKQRKAARAGGADRFVSGQPINGRIVVVPFGCAAVIPSSKPIKGAVFVKRPAGRRSYRVQGLTGTAGGVTAAQREYAQATEDRAVAYVQARAARAAIKSARASRLADFKAGTRNLRAGWLQTDKASKASQ